MVFASKFYVDTVPREKLPFFSESFRAWSWQKTEAKLAILRNLYQKFRNSADH